jgi:Uma2 family endonuclease
MTVESIPLAASRHGEPWTVDDLASLPPDDPMHYEIVDGSLVVSPPASAGHSMIAILLCRLIDRQIPDDMLVGQDTGISIRAGSTYYQPDGLVAPKSAFARKFVDPTDVLLVFEVLSRSNRAHDLVQKRHDYAVTGIPQYWIVDPDEQTITVLSLVDKVYVERAVLKPGDIWHTDEPLALTIDPTKVFD